MEERKPFSVHETPEEERARLERARKRDEETARLMEDTRRLSRQSDIKFAVALGISIAAIVLRIVLTVKQVLH